MSLKQYAVIKDSGGTLSADKIIAEVGDISMPVLWLAEGRFSLIPQPIVQNLLDLHKELQQVQGPEQKPILQVMWSQGIVVDNQIGRALLDE